MRVCVPSMEKRALTRPKFRGNRRVGIEIKNLVDCESGILLRLEIVGPKEEMRRRQYSEELGAGTALMLRLTHPWKSSDRVVIADSAFASVKTAVALRQRAELHFLGLVKTAYREYPKNGFNNTSWRIQMILWRSLLRNMAPQSKLCHGMTRKGKILLQRMGQPSMESNIGKSGGKFMKITPWRFTSKKFLEIH